MMIERPAPFVQRDVPRYNARDQDAAGGSSLPTSAMRDDANSAQRHAICMRRRPANCPRFLGAVFVCQGPAPTNRAQPSSKRSRDYDRHEIRRHIGGYRRAHRRGGPHRGARARGHGHCPGGGGLGHERRDRQPGARSHDRRRGRQTHLPADPRRTPGPPRAGHRRLRHRYRTRPRAQGRGRHVAELAGEPLPQHLYPGRTNPTGTGRRVRPGRAPLGAHHHRRPPRPGSEGPPRRGHRLDRHGQYLWRSQPSDSRDH